MKRHSLVRDVTVSAAGVVLGALVLVGMGTAGVLHHEARHALDRTLLAAVHAHARPEGDATWEVEHSEAPVDVWVSGKDDPRVSARLRAKALDFERPLFVDQGNQRWVLVAAEAEHRPRESDEDHVLVVATARKVTWRRSVGGFLFAFGGVAPLVALLAGGALGGVVRRALLPLEAARRASVRVVRHGEGARLPVEGPAEVQDLLADINALLDRLDRAFGVQARFTGEAAHELRTPVTALLGEIDVALRRPRSAESYRETLVNIRQDVDRLRALVNGLIGLARLDAGQTEVEREPARASELLDAALADEQPALQEAGCHVHVFRDADPEVVVQRVLLVAALSNLLRNAARYAPGTTVNVTVRIEGPYVVFWVDDSGPGVAPEEREAIFERFTRLGSARRAHPGGLGLGLSLTREVARRHGGDCQVAESPTGGCRAILTVFQSSPQSD